MRRVHQGHGKAMFLGYTCGSWPTSYKTQLVPGQVHSDMGGRVRLAGNWEGQQVNMLTSRARAGSHHSRHDSRGRRGRGRLNSWVKRSPTKINHSNVTISTDLFSGYGSKPMLWREQWLNLQRLQQHGNSFMMVSDQLRQHR